MYGVPGTLANYRRELCMVSPEPCMVSPEPGTWCPRNQTTYGYTKTGQTSEVTNPGPSGGTNDGSEDTILNY